MPELAEITLITKRIKILKNLTCTKAKLYGGKVGRIAQDNFIKLNQVLPLRVKNIDHHGKFIWMEFWVDESKNSEDDVTHIGFHLGLVGKLRVFYDLDNIQKYDHALFYFTNDKKDYYLAFNDFRNFGNICVLTSPEYIQIIKKIGPPLNKLKNWEHFRDLIKETSKGKKMPIAQILLIQEIISGVGNYMRNEALYSATINPYMLKNKLSDHDYKKLYAELMKVYQWGLKCQVKEVNYYKTDFKVYRQKKDPHGNDVIKEDIAKRTIYWVPKIQGRGKAK